MRGQQAIETGVQAIRNSNFARLVAVGLLALLLQIPISKIGGLVGERQERRDAAASEVTGKWGTSQQLVGPALVVPWIRPWEDRINNVTRTETRQLVVLPKTLHVRGKLASETRQRGIFSIPVYGADLELTGSFVQPDVKALGIDDPTQVAWDKAQLVVGLGDPRSIQNAAAVVWRGTTVAFLPGNDGFKVTERGIHAPVDASGADGSEFAIHLNLHGSLGLYAAPFGETTTAAFESNSSNPSFQGAWLPKQREITPQGFAASWEVPYLNRTFPQAWLAHDSPTKAIQDSQFGVDLVAPVDHYRMAERSVKYAGLFILLTFVTVWLIGVISRIQVHPIQYLLLGSALCLFYLLELSLAEHVGFPLAYALASTAIVALIGAYSLAILRRRVLALTVAAGVAGLYGYLYVLLMNEDSALLIGSIGLFAILASVMFVTRNVDWYAMGAGQSARAQGA